MTSSMPLSFLVCYLFALFFGAGGVVLAYHIYYKYQSKYLGFYLYFLIAYNIVGLFNIIGTNVVFHIFPNSPDALNKLNYLFSLIAFPFVPLMVGMFIYFVTGLLGQRIQPFYKKAFFLVWGALFMAYLLVARGYFLSQNDRILSRLVRHTTGMTLVCLYLAIFYLLYQVKMIPGQDRGKMTATFGFILLGSYAGYGLLAFRVIPLEHLNPFCYFILNFPSLLYLRFSLARLQAKQSGFLEDHTLLAQFFIRYSISKREQEVIGLVLQGRSHREIERALCISRSTVKNHVYNVYRKLEVKNKHELIHLIRNHGP